MLSYQVACAFEYRAHTLAHLPQAIAIDLRYTLHSDTLPAPVLSPSLPQPLAVMSLGGVAAHAPRGRNAAHHDLSLQAVAQVREVEWRN